MAINETGSKNKIPIGVAKEHANTILDDLWQLKIKYAAEYLPKRKITNGLKDAVRAKYKKLEEKVSPKNYTKNYLHDLHKKRKEEISVIDTPCLDKYYLARNFCTKDNRVDYSHLIRTYTLSSRYTFECLDTSDRYNNFKTPRRKPVEINTRLQVDGPATPTLSKKKKEKIL